MSTRHLRSHNGNSSRCVELGIFKMIQYDGSDLGSSSRYTHPIIHLDDYMINSNNNSSNIDVWATIITALAPEYERNNT